MIYEERHWGRLPAYLLLFVLAMLVLSPWLLHMRELYFNEGFYAALTDSVSGLPPMATLFGKLPGDSYPLFPLLAKLFCGLGFTMETALRLVPFCSLLMLTGIVMLLCRLALDDQAVLAGGAVMTTVLLVCDKLSEGTPVLLCALGIFSAWMIWFDLGIWRADWRIAWIFSGWIAGLTFYAFGWTGLVLLIFPMFLLRRPLTVWSKPRGPAFAAGFMLLVFFILLWGIPRWNSGAAISWYQADLRFPTIGKYLKHLLTFPFDMAFRFMPWTLFAWAPFCPALQTLDKNPILCKYLRTLFTGTVVLLWISPFSDSRDMLIALPPLAALIGLNYWIVVRRYGWRLLKLCEYTALLVMILSLISLLLSLTPETILKNIPLLRYLPVTRENFSEFFFTNLIYVSGSCVVALAVWFSARRGTAVWCVMMSLVLSFTMLYNGVILPRKLSDREHTRLGTLLRESLKVRNPASVTIYKSETLPRLYAEMHYAGTHVKTFLSEQELHLETPVIYVLSNVVPSIPERTWTLLCGTTYNQKRLELWKGERKRFDYENE